MHEYGIVQDLLSRVDYQVRSHQGARAVRVVIAVDGGHLDEAFLRDAFDTFKTETTASGAELVVERKPVQGWCLECGAHSVAASEHAVCPSCGCALVLAASGDDIYLQSVEIEV
jgi:hydrogenase nickel insertion protein HypA